MATNGHTDDSNGIDPTDDDGLRPAYDAVADALGALSLPEHSDQWFALQRRYHDLKAALLARDPEFQTVDLPGTRIHAPSAKVPHVPPTVEDGGGEWMAPTAYGAFRVLDGLEVADPTNPHTTHAVHVDHVVYPDDGKVTIEVNGTPLPDLLD